MADGNTHGNWQIYMNAFGQWYAVAAEEGTTADGHRTFESEFEACTKAIRLNRDGQIDLENRIRQLESQRERALKNAGVL